MALIECHECKAKISDEAKACPQCGAAPPKKTSRLTWVIGGFFAIAIAMSIFGNDSPTAAPKSPEQLATEKQKDKEFSAVVLGAKALKASAKNPDSFKLVDAIMMGDGSICYTYRGTNSFNAVVTNNYVITKRGGSDSADTWNKHCGGKTGTDYGRARDYL